MILENGDFNVNQQNREGNTILHFLSNNFIDLSEINKLMELFHKLFIMKEKINISHVNSLGESPLHTSCYFDIPQITSILLKFSFPINAANLFFFFLSFFFSFFILLFVIIILFYYYYLKV